MDAAAAARAPCQPLAPLSSAPCAPARVTVREKRFPAVGDAPAKLVIQNLALEVPAERLRRAVRAVGLRQDHAAQPDRRAGSRLRRRDRAAARRRAIGYVFQEPRLLPWLTVEDNLRLVLADAPGERGQDRRLARRDGPRRRARGVPDPALARHGAPRRAGARLHHPADAALDGRAVRLARRADRGAPAPAAARDACARIRRPCCSSPTICARRSCSPTGSRCCRRRRPGCCASVEVPLALERRFDPAAIERVPGDARPRAAGSGARRIAVAQPTGPQNTERSQVPSRACLQPGSLPWVEGECAPRVLAIDEAAFLFHHSMMGGLPGFPLAQPPNGRCRCAVPAKSSAAIAAVALIVPWLAIPGARGADHNDPNSVNSIFSDIDVSAADLYDLFGYPGDDRRAARRWSSR